MEDKIIALKDYCNLMNGSNNYFDRLDEVATELLDKRTELTPEQILKAYAARILVLMKDFVVDNVTYEDPKVVLKALKNFFGGFDF